MLLIARDAAAQPPMVAREPAPAPAQSAPSRPAPTPNLGTFLGGVPTGTATTEPIALSVTEAIERALRYNLGLVNAEQSMDRANGSRLRELADLLPNVNGRVS